MSNLVCIECAAELVLEENPMLGEIIECPECGLEFEVVNLNPLQIDMAPEIEEDWGE